MRKLPLPSILCLLALSACAPNVFRADVGAMFIAGGGQIALQNAGGTLILHNEQNQLDGDLGLGDLEASPYVRLQWDRDEHRVRAHGFGIEASGSGTLAGDFGGIVAGTQVNTTMTFFSTAVSYAYQVYRDQDWRIGLGGQIGYSRLDVTARSGTGREEVQTDILVPMPYGEAEFFLGPVTFGASASVMAADIQDANGRYLDIEALARWQATAGTEILVGYRHLVLDARGRASSRDFDADLDFNGWFIGGGVRF